MWFIDRIYFKIASHIGINHARRCLLSSFLFSPFIYLLSHFYVIYIFTFSHYRLSWSTLKYYLFIFCQFGDELMCKNVWRCALQTIQNLQWGLPTHFVKIFTIIEFYKIFIPYDQRLDPTLKITNFIIRSKISF